MKKHQVFIPIIILYLFVSFRQTASQEDPIDSTWNTAKGDVFKITDAIMYFEYINGDKKDKI